MEGIEHRKVSVNGISMHVAEKGEGPTVLLIHGFPELWYSWRHQIHALAAHGYRAVAPDMRGYGETDAPASPASYTIFHVVGDLIALLDVLAQDQVYVVGQDWGAIVAWYLCLFRPDRVKALVNLSVNFLPRIPSKKPIEMIREFLGDDHYICRFQEPGATEADFASMDTAKLLTMLIANRNPHPLKIPKDGLRSLPDLGLPLPSWLSKEDIDYYAHQFDKTGFTGGLNYYRALDLSWELLAPWTGAQVTVPVKFIIGSLDLTYNTPGCKDYIHGGGFKKDVPSLQEVVVMDEVGHFINQERPNDINAYIFDFFEKY
ncbi:uncharacterized protein LOC131231777 isoform X1 [Magnolia sinica]|uniref:uncharacterized protein LOC131231777 isoform X1 n=1 Tax=Magnolia sinica TaxID=86752 RepID=UPI002659A997|nr:uncharacterized protein LOC131231777 isoform X1 [Magnolia sinica]